MLLFFSHSFLFAQNNSRKCKNNLLYKGDVLYNQHFLDSALYYYNSAIIHNEINPDEDIRCDAYTRIAGVYIDLYEYNKSHIYLDSANALITAKKIENKEVLFRFYCKQGKLSFFENLFKESLYSFDKARIVAAQLPKDTLFAELELYSGVTYFMLGDRIKAVTNINKLLFAGKKYNEKYSNEMMYSLFFKIFYLSNKNISEIKTSLKLGERILKENKDTSVKSMGYLYKSMGLIYMQVDEYNKALNCFAKFKEVYSSSSKKNDTEYLKIENYQGNCYFGVADYYKAKRYLEISLKADSLRPYLSGEEKINTLLRLALTLIKLEEYNNAAQIYLNILEQYKTISSYRKANIYDNIATTYKELNNLKESEKFYKHSIFTRLHEIPDDKLNLARTYHNYGDLCVLTGKYKESNALLQKSLSIFKLIGEKGSIISRLYLTMGELELVKNNYKSALNYYQKAIDELCDSKFLVENPKSWPKQKIESGIDLLIALKEKAKVYEQMANNDNNKENNIDLWQSSLNCYKAAAWVADTIRGGFQLNESKLFLAGNEKELYTNAIESAYQLYNLTKKTEYINLAFQFSERSKSALLLANVQEENEVKNGSIPKNISEKLKTLKYGITKLEYKVKQSAKYGNNSNLEYQSCIDLFKLYDKQEELISQINLKYPNYSSISYRPVVNSVLSVMGKLNRDEVLIEYTMSEKYLYTFVITSNEMQFLKNENVAKIKDDVNFIYKACSEYNSQISNFDYFKKYSSTSNSLYHYLLGSVKTTLRNKKIIFVPDDILCFLPFETLLEKKSVSTSTDYSTLSYLIKSNSVSYANSASVLFNSKTRLSPVKNDLIAFAPKYEPNNSNLIAGLVTRSALVPIAGAKEEVISIEKEMDGLILSDENASETEFKELVADYNVIHMAMHCVADSINPAQTVLVFGNGGKNDDGILYDWEIAALTLNSSMAVLSACNTGIGKLFKGEGVMSIARAFLIAGCPTVVMTLWEVADLTSTNLMSSFYKYLSDGDYKDIALQKAKLDYISSSDPLTSHPYFWAGYVCVGNTKPITTEFKGKNYVFAISGSSILIVLISIIIRKRKKQIT